MPTRRPALLPPALALNVLIASGTFLVAKATLREFPPLVLVLFRLLLASSMLWAVARFLRPGRRIARSDRGRILLLGFLVVPCNQGLFLYGLQWSSASHAALLYALTPAFVSLILLVRGARTSLRQVTGVATAFLGVLTLLLQRGLHFDQRALVGDLLILGAVVGWSSYLVAGREVTRRYGPLLVTAYALLAGTLMFLPVGLLALRGFDPGTISAGSWTGLLYLGWLTLAVNYVIWFWGMQYLKPASVALLTNLQPPVTVAMAWALLHEPLPAGFALSAVLVLAGVWITQSAPRGACPVELASSEGA